MVSGSVRPVFGVDRVADIYHCGLSSKDMPLILAAPGTGKTTWVQKHPGWHDMDTLYNNLHDETWHDRDHTEAEEAAHYRAIDAAVCDYIFRRRSSLCSAQKAPVHAPSYERNHGHASPHRPHSVGAVMTAGSVPRPANAFHIDVGTFWLRNTHSQTGMPSPTGTSSPKP